jgi:hypothetical protein
MISFSKAWSTRVPPQPPPLAACISLTAPLGWTSWTVISIVPPVKNQNHYLFQLHFIIT